MASSNYIRKVAVVGATGNVGQYITEALLKTGKHAVTAVTRVDSESKTPEGTEAKRIDYEKPETIVEALKGSDALVVSLGAFAPKDAQEKLINAAGEVGIRWILPNEWSPDTANEDLLRDVSVFQPKVVARKQIADLGKSSYISVSTGFWYEWSLAIAPAFGIDLLNHKATLFDDGETKISTSTWPQVGRTVAQLLSLPIKRSGAESGPCLEDYENKMIYANSFTISQKEMLESAFRVTETKESDWSITKEPSHERYATGMEETKKGNRIGFAKMLYTRVFYPDGSGDTEHGKGSVNEALGLPKEDLDEATRRALVRAQTTKPWA